MVLGTLAVRWDAGDLAIVGVVGAATLRVGALLLATGTRPATLGELGAVGDRCAGVLPGSAALHLIESGLLPGWRPVVYGGGGLAARCSEMLLAAGAREVTVVSDSQPTAPFPRQVRLVVGWRLSSVHGISRVEAVWIERGDSRERLAGDALLLAAGRIPMRNVDGAIFPREEPDDGLVVPCHSSADPKSLDDATRTAQTAVARVLEWFGTPVARPTTEGVVTQCVCSHQ
jgi:hypothetical protein